MFEKELPNVLKQVYEDGVQAPVRSLSSTISDLWFLVFGGISHAADKRHLKYARDIEDFRKEFSLKIDEIPENRRSEPDIQTTAQALENSKYCVGSSELRTMFVNLISRSVDTSYCSDVHPSFSEIIKQMSPIDAKILKTIPIKGNIPIVDYATTYEFGSSYEIRFQNVYLANLPDVDFFKECEAISSLVRFGLLNIERNTPFVHQDFYTPYEKTPIFQELSRETSLLPDGIDTTLFKHTGHLTPLGQRFVSVCIL